MYQDSACSSKVPLRFNVNINILSGRNRQSFPPFLVRLPVQLYFYSFEHLNDLMHVSLLDKTEIETSRTSEKSWRGGGGWAGTGPVAARPERYRQDVYVHWVTFMLCIADHNSEDYRNRFHKASG